jgi:recombination protein RecA
VNHEIVKKSGSWYAYNEDKLGQGLEKTKQYLLDTPDLLKEIEEKLMNKISPEEFIESPNHDDSEVLDED